MRFDDMLEKILIRLQHNGQADEVEHDPERQRLRLNKKKEEGSFYAQSYDEMRNETFWEELVARLSERKLLEKYGDAHLTSLGDEERKKLMEPVSKKLWEEFSRNGIGNLHVVSRHGEG